MTRLFWILFWAATLAGLVLTRQPAGTWPWWDSAWSLTFFVASYAGLVSRSSLPAARLAAGVVIFSLAVVLGVGTLAGWPVGPVRFTENSGLRLGGALPLVLPLFGFALLTASREAAGAAFPGAGRAGLAAATAGALLLTLINGLTFLGGDRLWWLWNPWGDGAAPLRAASSLAVLALAAAALFFAYPPDVRLRLSRWTEGSAAWVAINALFLAARLP